MIAWAASRVLFSFFEEKDGGLSQGGSVAAAAGNFRFTIRILADKLAFWLGALRLGAFPIASRLFTDSLALRFRGLHKIAYLAMGDAVRLFAYSHTFRAVLSLAGLIRAFDFAFWFLALYLANCIFGLLTGCSAGRRLAYWLANCLIYALPGHFGSSHFQEHSGWHFVQKITFEGFYCFSLWLNTTDIKRNTPVFIFLIIIKINFLPILFFLTLWIKYL